MTTAEELTWHDASIDAVHYDELACRFTWRVEVFRWDISQANDAESGLLIFEGVQEIERLHDMVNEPAPESSWGWEVLDGIFERTEGLLRCRFLLQLRHRTNGLGGSGYGELIVTCQNTRYTPDPSP